MLSKDVIDLLGGAQDPGLAITSGGSVLGGNAAAARLLGMPREHLAGRNCWDLLQGTGDHREEICLRNCFVLQRAASGEGVAAFDCEVETTQGRRWMGVLTILVTTKDAGRLVLHLLRDIDTAKRLELLLRALQPEAPVQAPASEPRLSAQERTVLRHLSEGLATKDIAVQLGVTVATVRNHIQHVLNKLSVHSRTEAVVHAIRDHLV